MYEQLANLIRRSLNRPVRGYHSKRRRQREKAARKWRGHKPIHAALQDQAIYGTGMIKLFPDRRAIETISLKDVFKDLEP